VGSTTERKNDTASGGSPSEGEGGIATIPMKATQKNKNGYFKLNEPVFLGPFASSFKSRYNIEPIIKGPNRLQCRKIHTAEWMVNRGMIGHIRETCCSQGHLTHYWLTRTHSRRKYPEKTPACPRTRTKTLLLGIVVFNQ
jgi:hypothetical protein